MSDIYQGDPKMYLTENGADFNFPGDGGQPEMEQGVENLALISLFTDENWEGNFYLKKKDEKLGSNYREVTERPITVSNLELTRQSTVKSLQNPAFGDIQSSVTSPASSQRLNIITIPPRGSNQTEIILQQNGLNWVNQAAKGQE